MKIKLDDLQKALKWIEKNSGEAYLRILTNEQTGHIVIKTFDLHSVEVTISLPANDTKTYPKITKTENL
jgi:hypothetical protein